MSITRENFIWHKLHSLTGIIPVGFYMIQHLTLNSFSLAGEKYFNGVIDFFGKLMPRHILFALEIGVIALPLLFHGVYGLFITNRGQANITQKKYFYTENLMYTLQRISGLALFVLLILHVWETTIRSRIQGEDVIKFAAWHDKLTSYNYSILALYMLGVFLASYHLAFGIWNFCIRWGIAISEEKQLLVRKISTVLCVAFTLLGWAALLGFVVKPDLNKGSHEPIAQEVQVQNANPSSF